MTAALPPDPDLALVRRFLLDGARRGGDGRLKIEDDCLVLDAWWPVAFRVAPEVIALRADPPVDPTPAVDLVRDGLERMGLIPVATDPPLLHIITYAEIAWGLVSWTVYALDPTTADAVMTARAGTEPMLSPRPGDLPF